MLVLAPIRLIHHLRLILVLFFLFALSISASFGQTAGDYRSAASTNWETLTTWERYNGTTWVTPTAGQGWPGEFAGTGAVNVLAIHTVTITGLTTVQMGTVTISGTVNLNTNANVTITTNILTIITPGTISFNGNVILYLPPGAVIIVTCGGLSGVCDPASVRIMIGLTEYRCTEGDFRDLMAGGGNGVVSGTSPLCIGETATYTYSGTQGGTWTSTANASVDPSTGLVTALSAGPAVITYTISRCSGTATASKNITINPLPTITGTLSVCIGSTTTLTGSATPDATTPWASASPAVATVTSGGVVTGVSAGTSVITYKNNNGCTITATVTVNALPTITGTLSVCAGLTTQLTGSATAAAVTPWVSATPAVATVSNTGLVTGVSAGTSMITYTNTNGCIITATVTVNALPTITGTLSVCVGLTTQLTGSATANAVNPWVSATPAVATVSNTGLVTGVSVGTSVITYTNTNGCIKTATVTVNALPTITGTLSVCAGLTTQLTGSATAAAVTPWVSATPAVATVSNTGLVTGVSAGTSVITYTNTNGCIITATVTVNALPTITGTLSVCVGLTTQLTGSATAAAVTPWVSATPAVATVSNTGLVTGVSAGTSVITYTNTNGCIITATVTVNALPTITGTLSVCAGLTTQLTGSATAAAINPWESATPAVATVSNTGLVTGVSAGTSVITYTNTNGCIITATVTVNTAPVITAQPTAPAVVCSGSGIQTISVTATGSGLTYSWRKGGVAVVNGGVNSGQGTSTLTLTNPILADAGSYDVVITGTCAPAVTSDAVTITVNALPTPVITGLPTACVGVAGYIYSTPVVSGHTYSWAVGGAAPTAVASANSITVTWGATGVGTVDVIETITATGCSASATQLAVNVNSSPICSITGASGPVCPSSNNNFNGPAGMSGYAWSITSGTASISGASNLQSVSVISSTGNNTSFVLSLTVTGANSCQSTCSQTVTVSDNIAPTFNLPITDVSYCVNSINDAVFKIAPTVPGYDDLTTPRPEYYRFLQTSTEFNLDPVVNIFADNCCAVGSLVLHWRIVFSPTPDPADPAHAPITVPAIPDQTGQPSLYGSDIDFPSDGVTFINVTHKIYYRLVDCNGNASAEQILNITIKPRPKIN